MVYGQEPPGAMKADGMVHPTMMAPPPFGMLSTSAVIDILDPLLTVLADAAR